MKEMLRFQVGKELSCHLDKWSLTMGMHKKALVKSSKPMLRPHPKIFIHRQRESSGAERVDPVLMEGGGSVEQVGLPSLTTVPPDLLRASLQVTNHHCASIGQHAT